MKTILSAIFLTTFVFLSFTGICKSQDIDTVNTYGFGKMPPIYMGNKLYWERHYEAAKGTDVTVLTYICLAYNSCKVGAYTEFYPSGKIKQTGQYKENTTDDWSDLKGRGFCTREGEWKEYSEDGTLKKTYLYENDKVVKEY